MTRSLEIDRLPIPLIQAIKLAGWAEHGGEGKAWVAEGRIRVNGQIERRKRRKLQSGDTIEHEDGRKLEMKQRQGGAGGSDEPDAPPT
jgi:ribosome-associated protein